MSSSAWSRSRRSVLAAVAGAGMVAATLSTTGAATAAPPSSSAVQYEDGSYVVIFKQAPSTTYEGGVPGYAATRAVKGKGFSHARGQVKKYEAYLEAQQREVLAEVGAQPIYTFTTAINAAAVKLTGRQAAELSQQKNVLAVTPDEVRSLDTIASPSFLGLEGEGGVWGATGGVEEAGAGTVVGVIDTGYWPESRSFAGDPLATASAVSEAAPGPVWSTQRAPGGAKPTLFHKADGEVFRGACVAGEEFPATTCNEKVISARYFDSGFVNSVKRKDWSDAEFRSARDGGGHGSHTASTAAGNHGVPMSVDGRSFGDGSGVAPAAKLAVYKVCWEDTNPNTGGCYTSDSVAAINQAVRDGVDVINYSISGAQDTVIDAVEFAFLGAAAAEIFVAASAGNSGPTASTVAHNSPWLTTVAASTHIAYEGTVVLPDGRLFKGASISDSPVPATRAVLSADVGIEGAKDVALCAPGSLDPALVQGKIVVCDRGLYDRVAKSAEVARAGGVGMVLANVSAGSLDADFHSVPTVHVDEVAGEVIKEYVAEAEDAATLELAVGNITGDGTPVPQIAGFSSRGPAAANGSSLIKPDITAPGVSVLAAVAPPSGNGRDFDLYSGTSMSSPHIAGLAALYLAEHPAWSPSYVKSAMMTTAYNLQEADGDQVTDPFVQGAGHVDPTRFFSPGLVLDSGVDDWLGFITGQGLDTKVPAIEPSDLNYPSIAVGQLPGERTITRSFTAIEPGTYEVSVDVPGFDVTTSSSALTFTNAGGVQELTMTFTTNGAELAEWAKGVVTLDGPQTVRLPVALRPVSVAAPAEVSGSGASGSVDVSVTAGFTGELAVETAGLAEGVVQTGAGAAGYALDYEVEVAEDTSFARFDLDATDDEADLDLYVYRLNDEGRAVALHMSATGAADERVDLIDPEPGTYRVIAEVYSTPDGASSTAFTQTDYLVTPETTLGGLTVSPNPVPVVQNQETEFAVSWSGVEAGTPYLGWLGYEGALAPTVISVN